MTVSEVLETGTISQPLPENIKPIAGWEGYYVSDLGNVYSKWERCFLKAKSGISSRLTEDFKLLRPGESGGRLQVCLYSKGKRRTVRIHILVLTTFVGLQPKGYVGCHFPDKNTSNNKLENLRWDTSKANQLDRVFHKTTGSGENSGSSKLKVDQVVEIRQMRSQGDKLLSIANKFNVSLTTISDICAGKKWSDMNLCIKRGQCEPS